MLGAQRVARARSADLAAGDDDELVAEALDDVELMGREQHRRSTRRAFLKHAGDDVDGERIQARERLVEDQHLRLVHEGRRDLRTLLVAQRQRLDVVIEALAESELLEQGATAGRGLRLRVAVQSGEVDDLLEHLHLGVQAALLRHVAEATPLRRGDLGAVKRDRPPVVGEHTQDDAHRRGLARAVAAYESGEAAGSYVERHVVQHAPPAVTLRDPSELQHPVSFVDDQNATDAAGMRHPPAGGLSGVRHPPCGGEVDFFETIHSRE